MNESRRLTLRELRILHETERALLRDARLAALFRGFGETEPEEAVSPAADGPATPPRLWLLLGVCFFLVPALMVLHPVVGVLVFLSAVVLGTAFRAGRRPGRPGRRGPGTG
ncbi:hypothetical protein ACLIYM_13630 [Streptomyces fenghuangensis]|uniref:DUF3040 domain-containing protein n=1 Tax=Streptomyces chitinivorans TaxID=1257027 RepID=A0ABW7HYF5_9ACTN|nr:MULTISPECIES: hypothetical protein [Streptomyces]MCG3040642.1 hypothetical protein [Streptomyces sp. ICN903]MDH2409991.1 hypothetical protein [Streptomyces chitinivorans]